jgi:uncharacterized membrane protein YhiD involved in acid resistance
MPNNLEIILRLVFASVLGGFVGLEREVHGREAGVRTYLHSWSTMPVMDGYEATRKIKATAKGKATTIIALTASAFEESPRS